MGFTLIEVMIVVAIVAILAAIAVPAYSRYVAKTNRVAAEACLAQYANYMERFYTTNLRYDQDSGGNAPQAASGFDCASAQQTGANYKYSFPTPAGSTTNPSQTSYIIQAAPQGAQATRDATCGTLTLDQTGKRDATGGVTACWQ